MVSLGSSQMLTARKPIQKVALFGRCLYPIIIVCRTIVRFKLAPERSPRVASAIIPEGQVKQLEMIHRDYIALFTTVVFPSVGR